MKLPKISIVIPSYNKVEFIGKTLDSIVGQKYQNLEVFIQDGGSTDGTLEIIKRYAKKHPKIFRWESKKDKGQVDAINNGLKKTSGEILTFINADDVYERGALKRIAEMFQDNPKALWFAGRGGVINKKGREIAKLATLYKNFLLSLNFKFFLLITNYLMQPSVFMTRRAYKKYGPFIGTKDFVTEYDLWLKLSKVKMPVVINKVLSKFRIEGSTKTKQMSTKLLREDKKVVRKYTKNPLLLFLHSLHNFAKMFIGRTL